MRAPTSLISLFIVCVLIVSGTCSLAQDHSTTKPQPANKQAAQPDLAASLRAAVDEQKKSVDAAKTADERLKLSKRLADLEIQLTDALAAQGQYVKAADWYTKADRLRQENYQIEKAGLEEQIQKLQALTQTKRADTTLSESDRANFIKTYQSVIDGLLSGLDSLASERNDTATRLNIAERRLALARESNDPTSIAAALQAAAETQRKAGNLALARATAEEALQIRQNDSRRKFIYETVRLLAWIADDANDWREAEARYREVIEMTKPGALPDLFDLDAEADADMRRAKAPANAQDRLNRARTALDSRVYLADLIQKQGNLGQAEQQYRAIVADISALYAISAPDEADVFKWIAGREKQSGNLINQIKSQVQAADVIEYRKAHSVSDDDSSRLNLAEISAKSVRAQIALKYAALLADEGELDDAATAYQDAIVLFQNALRGSFPVVGAYSALAFVERERENYGTADAALNTALTIYQTQHDLYGLAGTLAQQSALRLDEKRIPEAMQLANDALTIARPLGYRPQIAGLLRALGRAEAEAGGDQLKASEQHLREALAVWRDLGLQAHVAYTLSSLGWTLEKQGRIADALASYEEAVNLVELLTRNLSSAEKSDVFNSTNGNRQLYDRLIRLLLKVGRTTDALGYYERAKSESLKDALAGAHARSPNPSLNLLLRNVENLGDSIRIAETAVTTEASSAKPDPRRLRNAHAQLADTQQSYLRAVKAIQQENPFYASLVAVTPTDLIEVRRHLPVRTALIEYFPTDTELYFFVMTPNRPPIVRSVPIGRDQLVNLVIQYRKQIHLIEDPDLGVTDVVQEANRSAFWLDDRTEVFKKYVAPLKSLTDKLYRTLITPVDADIAQADTVVFVPSGELYYLPLHALGRIKPDGTMDLLIQRKRVAYMSSADLLNVVTGVKQNNNHRPPPTRPMLALANPEPVGGNALPAANEEVDALRQVLPGANVYKEHQATFAHLKEAAGQVRYIHFATHGILEIDPKDSYLLLAGVPKELTVRGIVEDSYGLSFAGVDLVTLSACETNLGGFDPETRYSSLSRAFATAGVPSVLASMWQVDDPSTRDTMMTFYKELTTGQTKAEALRRAQLALMRNPKFAHPYFWSAFELIGDWR